MLFTGTYDHAIDSKHRVAIPAEVRKDLFEAFATEQGDAVRLYAVLGGQDVICLYTRPGYERLAEELRQSETDTEQLLAYEEFFYGMSRPVQMDKAGRVRLPENLLKFTGLSGEVTLIGSGDHLKIRERVDWEHKLKSALAENADLIVNPRKYISRNKERSGQ